MRSGFHRQPKVTAGLRRVEEAPMTEAKQRRSLEEAIVDTVREPLIVLDDALRDVVASRSFYRAFVVTPPETEGRHEHRRGVDAAAWRSGHDLRSVARHDRFSDRSPGRIAPRTSGRAARAASIASGMPPHQVRRLQRRSTLAENARHYHKAQSATTPPRRGVCRRTNRAKTR